MTKKRFHNVDIFKGICLMLVVIHHAPLAYMGHFALKGSFLWYNQHALILVSFLIFGQILKDFEITLYRVTIITIVPFFATVFRVPIFGYEIPTITRTIQVSLFSMPIFIFLSLSGSLIFWSISKLISESSWLEFIGRGSLVEYCFNYSTLCLVANVFNHYLGGIS